MHPRSSSTMGGGDASATWGKGISTLEDPLKFENTHLFWRKTLNNLVFC